MNGNATAARAKVVAVGTAALMLAVTMGFEARGAERTPSLRLLRSDPRVLIERGPEEPAPLDVGTYVAAVGGAFELHVRRDGNVFRVEQVVRDGDRTRVVRTLPADVVAEESGGLRDFFQITARALDGRQVASTRAPFCPVSFWAARMDDAGPDIQTYPSETGCWMSPLSRALVWGIDASWAVQNPEPYVATLDVPDGTYDVTIRIAQRYRTIFGIRAADAVAHVTADVTTYEWEWPEEDPIPRVAGEGPGRHRDDGHRNGSPEVQEDASGLPDLIALPAFAVATENIEGRDILAFGANVWNRGPGPLVVEGFRRPGAALMDAYQYFYSEGVKTGRAPVGTLEFDERDGHRHWHFTDFARYQLLARDGQKVERSGKEAFCLAPTDAIDLTLPTANWRPSWTGLHTSCGGARSLWIREILDVGWGDTYHQWLPGQSFDITDLPNGTYQIEVTTNPENRLRERSMGNNRSLRTVVIRGEPGARTVQMR